MSYRDVESGTTLGGDTDSDFFAILDSLKILQQQGVPASYINQKVTAKLQRQMADILIVASGLVPSWCRDLCVDYGFLVPFEDRLDFLQNVTFGTGRALMKWQ